MTVSVEVTPLPVGPFRAVQETQFERLKGRLLAQRLGEEGWDDAFNSQLRRAANEAAALARLTPYPLLLFPLLFDEKAQAANLDSVRAERVGRRRRELSVIGQ